MLNNELNDYSKQDPFDEIDEIDEPIFRNLILKGTVIFTKDSEESKVWWIDKIDVRGEILFSLIKKIYNLFRDYPHNMTEEEVRIFGRRILTGEIFSLDRKL